MKTFVTRNPETDEETDVCTFDLVNGKVVIEPPTALNGRRFLAEVASAHGVLTPSDGAAYYAALSGVRGSFYYVRSDKRKSA